MTKVGETQSSEVERPLTPEEEQMAKIERVKSLLDSLRAVNAEVREAREESKRANAHTCDVENERNEIVRQIEVLGWKIPEDLKR